MAVRRAGAGDVAEIARVQTASWAGAYMDLMPASVLENMTVEGRIAGLTRYMADQPTRSQLLVAESASEVVGMAWIAPNRDEDLDDQEVGEVLAIYVDPEHWDGGHGRELMVAAIEEMRTIGFSQAALWVLDTNERGRSFYERGGWFADGAVKIDETFGEPLREVRYRLNL
ncbi:MAG: GNAT family N-acetyltransferase [Acidimicrobiia bacterium]|nr:GNAT family N-acetyltransferase [Acidimicrobiia bacterium]